MTRASHALASQDAYQLWAATYPPEAHNALMRTEHARVSRIIEELRPARALDVGTGSGRYLAVLAEAGAGLAVALDFSSRMLARISRDTPRVCGDARSLPFAAGTFDLLNASLVAGDVPDLTSWLAGLARVLSPGGHLIYSDFHPSWSLYGWRRTFQTTDGRTIEIPYATHTIDDHLKAIRDARLTEISTEEIRLRDEETTEVTRFRERWGDPPVLVVVHAMKAM